MTLIMVCWGKTAGSYLQGDLLKVCSVTVMPIIHLAMTSSSFTLSTILVSKSIFEATDLEEEENIFQTDFHCSSCIIAQLIHKQHVSYRAVQSGCILFSLFLFLVLSLVYSKIITVALILNSILVLGLIK